MMWLREHTRRACTAALSAMALLVLAATPAAAAEDQGQAPPFLTWISLNDTRGISIWNYEMSIDRGGMTSPDKFFWSVLVDIAWQIYRGVCAISLWFLDWVLSFTWVPTVAAPLLAVGDAMQAAVNGIGLVPTMLTLCALVAVMWMARGRWATGIWELAMALVIASLASGVFAQPVRMIAGPDGFIVQASQVGQQLAAELATGEAAGMTPQELRAQQTGMLVDTFIRQPTQMVNFGQVLDGTECEAAYNDVVAAGPYGNDADVRDRMKDCDERLHEYASTPTAAMALGAIMFSPAAFVVLGLALVLAGSVVAAGCWAMYQALRAIITLIMGLLPGGGRGSLLLTITETLVSLLIIVFTSVFLGIFLLVIQALFAGADGEITKTFLIVDILIVVGIIVYWRARNSIKAMSKRLAGWMAQRPGASATRLPERSPGLSLAPVNSALHAASTLTHHRSGRRAAGAGAQVGEPGGARYVDGRQQVLFVNAAGTGAGRGPTPHYSAHPTPGGGPTPRPGRGAPPAPALTGAPLPPGLPPGPSPAPATATPVPEDPQGPSPRLRRAAAATGKLARAGTQVALAAATGGTSAAVAGTAGATRAAQVAQTVRTARRAAVTARMTAGTLTPGPAPVGPMRPRTQPAPVPGRAQHPRPADSQTPAVVQGQIVRSKLATTPPAAQPVRHDEKPAPAAKKPTPPAGSEPRPRTPGPSSTTRPAPKAAPRAASRNDAEGEGKKASRPVAHPQARNGLPPAVAQQPRPAPAASPVQTEAATRLQQRLADRTRRRTHRPDVTR